jgi:hypothetical protein
VRKNAKQFVELECCFCKQKFLKEKKEYSRRIKNGWLDFYCSASCFNKKTKADELSPFRFLKRRHFKSANQRKILFELTIEDVRDLWIKQNGKCAYTNLPMKLSLSAWDHYHNQEMDPTQVSIDRIDSNSGYIKGNVELVCLSVNYAKNGFPKQQMLDFFKQIKETQI